MTQKHLFKCSSTLTLALDINLYIFKAISGLVLGRTERKFLESSHNSNILTRLKAFTSTLEPLQTESPVFRRTAKCRFAPKLLRAQFFPRRSLSKV